MNRFSAVMQAANQAAADHHAYYLDVCDERAAENRALARKADLSVDKRRMRRIDAIPIQPSVLVTALKAWRKREMISQSAAARQLGVIKELYCKHEGYGLKLLSRDYYERLIKAGVELPPI